MAYSSEFLTEIKDLIRRKLDELGAFADEELPDYVTVMVANKKKRSTMNKDLQLFLGSHTENFTEWLHEVIESKTKSKSSHGERKHSETEKAKCSKSHKKEKSKKSIPHSESRRSKQLSPAAPRKPFEVAAEDIVNVQTEENEFVEETTNTNEAKSVDEKTLKEHRRVVNTSSLSAKSDRSPREEKPAVRSVVKVTKVSPISAQSGNKPVSASGFLFKQALNEAQTDKCKAQERPSAIVCGQKRVINRTDADQVDAEEAVSPKRTRFVVTMNENTPSEVKRPSVKSRLGRRVNASPVESVVAPTDVRQILLARKRTSRVQVTLDNNANSAMEDDDLENFDEGIESEVVEGDFEGFDGSKDNGNIPSSLQRCKYWPNCRNDENCQFIHPKEECKNFPNCRFGDRCLYIHPPCRFASKCTRPNCAYSHPFKDGGIGIRPVAQTKVQCRYFPKCKQPPGMCPFYHPPTPICRYGPECMYRATTCPFVHPDPDAVAALRSKFKWIAASKPKPEEKGGDVVTEVKRAPNETSKMGTAPI